MDKNIAKKSMGRPSVISDETVAKLVEVLQRGFSVNTACEYAEIDTATFYRHLQSDSYFSARIASARTFLTLASSEVVYNEIIYKKNVKAAMWWLERNLPAKYAKRSIVVHYHRAVS